jgi:hypothetical protein
MGTRNAIKLFDGATVDGCSLIFGTADQEKVLIVEGVLGGASLKLQAKPNLAADYVYTSDILDADNLSAIVNKSVDLALRLSLEGSTGTTNVTVYLCDTIRD